ncbi:unnamed protein product [Dicrocoelium dendriticum]|nr:unnamed protein product [Dicrocoelium dendriticum]
MTMETPYHRLMNSPNVQICEYIFFVAMTLEMALKIFARGLMFTPNALLKDFGGFLDFFNYLISLVFVVYMMRVETIGPESGEHILMVLRCLRPLRIFCLVPQMRRVVYELVRGFREILMVSVLLVVFMFTFAVYGVHLFGGRLAICNDRSIIVKEQCVGRFKRELAATKLKSVTGEGPKLLVPRVWANPRNFNFDNIGNAMLALFEVLSLEGWVEIRDVIQERIGPGTALLTVDQRRWLDLKGRIKLTHPLQLPPRPKLRLEPGQDGFNLTPVTNTLEKRSVKFRCFIYDVTQHLAFKRASAILVVINCGLLFFPFNEAGMDETNGVRERYMVQITLGIIFTLFFCVECLLKIIALSIKGYWQSKRNRFDLLVATLGCAWIVLHLCLRGTPERHCISNNFGWFVLMLRFLTIAGRHVTLKMLMLTVIMSMYKSLFIITSMFLLMLIYALAGVVLFGSVKYGDNLGRHANFQNAFRATALLTRIVTGEDWNKIMHDCMIQPPFCRMRTNFWETDCGNFRAALIYFCSFYVIITYVMLNVLVAIIMENFSLFYSNDEDAIMSYNDIRNFQLAWNVIDVNRKGMVKAYYVRFLLRLIPRERVGFDLSRKKDQQLFKEMCHEVEMLRGGRDKEVSFHDVLMVLAYRTVDITKTLQLEELIAREELEYAIEEEVARQTIAAWIERCIFRNRQKHGQLKFTMRPAAERQASLSLDEAYSHESAIDRSHSVAALHLKKRSAMRSVKPFITIQRESTRDLEQPTAANSERAQMITAPILTPADSSTVPSNLLKRYSRKTTSKTHTESLALLEAEEEGDDTDYSKDELLELDDSPNPSGISKSMNFLPTSSNISHSRSIENVMENVIKNYSLPFDDTCNSHMKPVKTQLSDAAAVSLSTAKNIARFYSDTEGLDVPIDHGFETDIHSSNNSVGHKPPVHKVNRAISGFRRVSPLPDVAEDLNETGEAKESNRYFTPPDKTVMRGSGAFHSINPDGSSVVKRDVTDNEYCNASSYTQKANPLDNVVYDIGTPDDVPKCLPSISTSLSPASDNRSIIELCEEVKTWWRTQLNFPFIFPHSPYTYSTSVCAPDTTRYQLGYGSVTNPASSLTVRTTVKMGMPGISTTGTERHSGAAGAIVRRNHTVRSGNLITSSTKGDDFLNSRHPKVGESSVGWFRSTVA